MIRNEKLRGLFSGYSKDELIYRKYRELQNDGRNSEEIYRILKNEFEGTNLNSLWLPEIYPELAKEKCREMVMVFEENIITAKHIRFHPHFTHTHQFFEMIYVLEGTCTNIVGNSEIVMEENSLCIIPPLSAHSIGVFEGCTIANILFKPAALDKDFECVLSGGSPVAGLLSGKIPGNSCLFLPRTEKDGLSGTIENLILEGFSNDSMRYSMKKALLLSLMISLSRLGSTEYVLYEDDCSVSGIINEIRAYIEKNISSVNLSDAAENFHYSSPYLSKLVHKNAGVPFNALVRDMKMAMACELLTAGTMGISEISAYLGYETPAYFTRIFKKYTGMSPRAYKGAGHHSPLDSLR